MWDRPRLSLEDLVLDTFATTIGPVVNATYTSKPGTYNDATAGCCAPQPVVTSSRSCGPLQDCT